MSLFNRFVTRPMSWWAALLIYLALLAVPLAVISLDNLWGEFKTFGQLRPFLVAPVVIIYILLVGQVSGKNDEKFLREFRPVVLVDDETFNRLVKEAGRVKPLHEVLAMLIGALFGLGLCLSWLPYLVTWGLRLYVPISYCLMHALLWWTIFYSIAGTRVLGVIHSQPLRVDLLDNKPFEPVGRYSLITALLFVGGITLGAVFGLDLNNLLAWQTWIFYLPFLAVPVVIFFISMRPTHRLLKNEKRRLLKLVGDRIVQVSREMQAKVTRGAPLDETAVTFAALTAYEIRLRSASTWPYNTGMLRTLFFTALLPLMMKGISVLLFGE